MAQDESFVRRWLRLKHASRSAAPASSEPTAAPVVPAPAAQPSVTAPASDGDTKDQLKLPPIDSLTADSDYAPFMRPEVPEEMRKLALRKLWASDPAYAVPDVLDLHNLDYTTPAIARVVRTAYQVGRGFLDDSAEAPAAASDQPQTASTPPPAVDKVTSPPAADQANADAPPKSAEKPSKPAPS